MELEYTPDDIDAFVRGKLSPEEREVFIQKMKENPALADAAADAMFVLDVSIELRKRELREKMKGWDEEKNTPLPPPGPAPAPRSSRPWAAALAAPLLVAAFFLFREKCQSEGPITPPVHLPASETDTVQHRQKDTAERRDSAQNVPTPPKNKPAPVPEPSSPIALSTQVLNTLRSQEGLSGIRGSALKQKLDTLEQANAWIVEKEYTQAEDLLQAVPPSSRDYWTAQMYLGDAYFFDGKIAKAEATYRAAHEQGRLDAPSTFWRLAAAHCAAGHCPALKAHLKSPPTGLKPNPERADALLKACR